MSAFAANSVLNRMAVGAGEIDPITFAIVRLWSGAGILAILLGLRRLRGGKLWSGWQGRLVGVFGLLVYLFGFSVAYLSLDAGVGALILFGSVQVTMFAGALVVRETVPPRRWLGAGLAFSGLVYLMAPGSAAVPSLSAGAAMTLAGVGWGIYSLAGRRAGDALGATAWNFLLAVPVSLLVLQLVPASPDLQTISSAGLGLAVVSGAITSGLGYALWYALVPQLGAARAAVAQLTVPVLAALGGALIIGEAVDLRFVLSTLLVLGGVALASTTAGPVKR